MIEEERKDMRERETEIKCGWVEVKRVRDGRGMHRKNQRPSHDRLKGDRYAQREEGGGQTTMGGNLMYSKLYSRSPP